MLVEKLQAVATIIGGTTVPTREELDCAYEELACVIKLCEQIEKMVKEM